MTPARLVVLGDALLDIDVETDVERLVPDSAAPVLYERRRVQRPVHRRRRGLSRMDGGEVGVGRGARIQRHDLHG